MKKERSLIWNGTIYSISTFIGMVIPIIIYPYVLRVLQPGAYGTVEYAMSIASYFVLLAQLGINRYAMRESAIVRGDENKWGNLIAELICICTIATAFALILFISFIRIFPLFWAQRNLYFIMGLLVLFSGLNIDWAYRSIERYDIISIRNVVIKVIALILILILVKKPSDFLIYALITVVSLSGTAIFNFLGLKSKSFPKIKTNQNFNIRHHIIPILSMTVINFGNSLYSNVDITVLNYFFNDVSVGLYSAARKVPWVIITIITTFNAVLFPRISNYVNNNRNEEAQQIIKRALNLLIILCLPAAITCYVFSDDLLLLIAGTGYVKAAKCLRIYALIIPINAIADLVTYQYLLPLKKEKLVSIAVLSSALINIILNIILVPYLNIIGAALSAIISALLILVIVIIATPEFRRLLFDKKNLLYIVGSFIILFIFIVLKFVLKFNVFVNLTISVFTAGIFYITYLVLIRDEIVLEIRKRIFKR